MPPERLEPVIDLEGRLVGEGQPSFLIAEIGVNHNGDLDLARRMIDAAAEAGADCVKFQTFRAEEFMADRKVEYEYRSAGRVVRENMFDMFKRLELPPSAYPELFAHSRRRGVVPLSSAADPESVDLLRDCGAAALKLSSEDLINLPLIDYAARSGLPLLLSTGMADAEEVGDALDILLQRGARRAVFLHCVSVYPAPAAEANLRRIGALRALVQGPVGYSDHTEGIGACVAAAALGACAIEKHFTTDRLLPGPDQALSSDPVEFKALAHGVRAAETLLGSAALAPSVTELETRRLFRRSVVASRDLPAGHVLEREDLLVKRPGHGLRAREIPRMLSRRLKNPVKRDEAIQWSHLEG